MICRAYTPEPHWQHATLCAPAPRRPAATIVEIGPGNGGLLRHLAATHPTRHIVGIELQWARFAQQRAQCRTFDNVSCVRGDARHALPAVTQWCGPVHELHIHFPDPWPKRKHGAHRLMTPDFARTCVAALAPQATLFFTTDHGAYAQHTAALFARHDRLQSLHPHAIVTEFPAAFPSYFSEKWRRAGRTIYYQAYRAA